MGLWIDDSLRGRERQGVAAGGSARATGSPVRLAGDDRHTLKGEQVVAGGVGAERQGRSHLGHGRWALAFEVAKHTIAGLHGFAPFVPWMW